MLNVDMLSFVRLNVFTVNVIRQSVVTLGREPKILLTSCSIFFAKLPRFPS